MSAYQGNLGSARTAPGAMENPFNNLVRPVSIGSYDQYADAQRAVDSLSDQQFPVEKLIIVGTDLKSIERVTGRLTWGKVIGSALLNAVLWAVGFALLLMVLFGGGFFWEALLYSVLFFAIFNVVTAAMIYGLTRGERDFTSNSRIVAARYEILVESEVADQARALLGGTAGVADQVNPAVQPPIQG